ncbi:hypothetical protein [Rickettsia endosymbiont of Halotydeus destructor]|uniref:hypothetical protein n=1 Tax=Rickettsia endosymbiont of Halotydeus destructor TaxID=2996754 RepID=UPI003BAE4D8F
MTNKSPFKEWKFLKAKEGGANEAGEYGGVYQSLDGQTTAMIKKEASPAKNISEFLGSQIFEVMSPGNGAKVSLIAPNNLQTGKSPNTDSEIYVKSEFFKNYSSDMYVDMDAHMSAATKPNSKFKKDGGRPLFMGTRNLISKTFEKAFKEVKYQNFENIMPASLLIGDFDIHIGNIGVIRDPKATNLLPKMVRIDFAGSLDKLTNNIHPNSRLRHLPGFGPTNHFREFPSFLRRKSPEFADSLLVSSKIDLDSIIDKSFEEMAKYYSNTALAAWAKQAMPKIFDKRKAQEITPEEIKNSFKDTMKKRQKSLKEYGLEVKLGTLITKKLTSPHQVDEKQLKILMQEYPEHFEKIINYEKGKKGGEKLKLSDKSLRGIFFKKIGVEKQLIKSIAKLVEEIKIPEQQNEKRSLAFKGTLKGAAVGIKDLSEKTELKPISKEYPARVKDYTTQSLLDRDNFQEQKERKLLNKVAPPITPTRIADNTTIKADNEELRKKISSKDFKILKELRNVIANVLTTTSKSISPSVGKKTSKPMKRERG